MEKTRSLFALSLSAPITRIPFFSNRKTKWIKKSSFRALFSPVPSLGGST